MRHIWLLCAALLISASPAWAAKWKVDPAKSTLNFIAVQSGKEFTGAFKKWSAEIDYDAAKLGAASIKVTVETASAITKDDIIDEHITEEGWFHSEMFPTATFMSKGFKKLPDGSFETEGALKIRKIEKKVKLVFQLEVTGNAAHAKGGTAVTRDEFELGKDTEAKLIGMPVKIQFELSATAE